MLLKQPGDQGLGHHVCVYISCPDLADVLLVFQHGALLLFIGLVANLLDADIYL